MTAHQYGTGQSAFIKKVRADIDKNRSRYFQQQAWHNIIPSGGRFDSTLLNTSVMRKTTIDSFYVKPIASWGCRIFYSTTMSHAVPIASEMITSTLRKEDGLTHPRYYMAFTVIGIWILGSILAVDAPGGLRGTTSSPCN